MGEMRVQKEKRKKRQGRNLRAQIVAYGAGKGVDRRRTDVMPSGTSFLNQWARLPLCGRSIRVAAARMAQRTTTIGSGRRAVDSCRRTKLSQRLSSINQKARTPLVYKLTRNRAGKFLTDSVFVYGTGTRVSSILGQI